MARVVKTTALALLFFAFSAQKAFSLDFSSLSSWSFNWSDPSIREAISLSHLELKQKQTSQNIISIIDSSNREFKNIFKLKNTRPLLIQVVEDKDFKKNYSKNKKLHALFINGSLVIKLTPKINLSSLKKTIRHEMAHVVIADSVQKVIPAWLDEGLAQYLEGGSHRSRAVKLKKTEIYKISFKKLTTNLSNLKNPQLAYAQSLFVVNNLIRKFGITKLSSLFRKIKAGGSFELSFKEIYRIDLESFEKNVNKQLLRWRSCSNCPL